MDTTNFLEQLLDLLQANQIQFCVIGGQGVNAYVEPVVSLDLDLVVVADQLERVEHLLAQSFGVKKFPHSLNVSLPGSDLRVQIQTDSRYFPFVERATSGEVLGLSLPVASLSDILRGKIWAAQDPERRASKRQKDLADIARLLEAYPELRAQTPPDILRRII